MLRSSTNIMHFFPIGGPKIPLRLFSNFESMVSWVWFAEVYALNVSAIYWYVSVNPDDNKVYAFNDLPVPVGPGKQTWKLFVSNNFIR